MVSHLKFTSKTGMDPRKLNYGREPQRPKTATSIVFSSSQQWRLSGSHFGGLGGGGGGNRLNCVQDRIGWPFCV